jgi:predicted aspartyl protease
MRILASAWLIAVVLLGGTAVYQMLSREAVGATAPLAAAPADNDLHEVLTKKGYTSVPMTRLKSGVLTVRAQVNGQDIQLLLDTGAPLIHVDPKRVTNLNLNWKKVATGLPESAPRASVAVSDVESLTIAGVNTGKQQLVAEDLSGANRSCELYGDPLIDGLLGLQALERHSAVVDVQNLRLYLLPAAKK